MMDEIALDLTKEDGSVEQKRVPISDTLPSVRVSFVFRRRSRLACLSQLTNRSLVGVSDNIAQLTRVTILRVGSRSALVA